MWSTLKYLIIAITILIIIYYFNESFKIVLLNYTFPDLLTAIGTVLTAFLAFYFGIFGNRQIKILIAEKERYLDQKAFLFLTELPAIISNSNPERLYYDTIGSEFENLILKEGIYLTQKNLKKFNYIIKLACALVRCPVIPATEKERDMKKALFYKIKKQIESKSADVNSITRLEGMQKIWDYESILYWENNIYLIDAKFPQRNGNIPALIYINKENLNETRELASIHFNDKFYLDEIVSVCERLSPIKYCLIKKKKTYFSNYIIIIFYGKKVKLKINQVVALKSVGFNADF